MPRAGESVVNSDHSHSGRAKYMRGDNVIDRCMRRLRKPGETLVSIVLASAVAIAGCSNSETSPDYDESARRMAAELNAGKVVAGVTILRDSLLPVTQEQTGVGGIAAIDEPIVLGNGVYAFFTSARRTGTLEPHVVRNVQATPQPLPGLEGAPSALNLSPSPDQANIAAACSSAPIANSPTEISRFCTAADGVLPFAVIGPTTDYVAAAVYN